jgi:hypothetical protein
VLSVFEATSFTFSPYFGLFKKGRRMSAIPYANESQKPNTPKTPSNPSQAPSEKEPSNDKQGGQQK